MSQDNQKIYRCGRNINDDNAYKGMEKAAKKILEQTVNVNGKNSKTLSSVLMKRRESRVQ